MRDQFEKLPEIARRIAESNSLNYNEESKGWRSPEWDSTTCCNEDFVNAAWYAFQEQQKKIDDVLNLVCKLQYSSGERIYSEVKELLK